MDDNKRLVLSLLHYLDDQQRSPALNNDDIESLDVAIQCLESVYKTSIRDVEAIKKFNLPASLPEIFEIGLNTLGYTAPAAVDKVKAEQLKMQGNDHMFKEAYKEAIQTYTEAIQCDPYNAIYYCNRAAAYSKLGDLQQSINDCQQATAIDPNYAKAYGRKGLAHSALNQHEEARGCYLKASQLDPANPSYQENLQMAETSLRTAAGTGLTEAAPGGAALGGLDFSNLSSMLNNPALVNMASSMLRDPGLQSMMSNLMTNMNQGDEAPGMDRLFQVGQQFAQQMHETNPELIEQLRNQATNLGTNPPPPSSTDEPPPPEQPPKEEEKK